MGQDSFSKSSPTLAAAKRDRFIIIGGIAVIAILAWVWLANMALDMPSGNMMSMASTNPWASSELYSMLLMWVIMMVGMMLPSATPMILIYTRAVHKKSSSTDAKILSSIFITGYLLIWVFFSVAATLLQASLQDFNLISTMLESNSDALAGTLFIMAGLYQITPLKRACLNGCRSPLNFILNNWKGGRKGGLLMGLEHGLLCVGCCWMMMLLLFAVGVMNLFWVASLAVLVLIEKAFPRGEWTARVGGISMLCAGVYFLSRLI